MAGLSNEDTTDALDNQVMVIESGDELSTDRAEVTADNRLKVQSQIEVEPDDISSCPVMSNKFRVELDETDITVPASFATMYSYSGSGKFFSFIHCYDDDDTEVRLTIDGDVIFSINLEDLDDFEIDGDNDLCGWFKLIQSSGDNRFCFCPPCAIRYETSVLIEARRTDSSNNELHRQLIFISKET